MRPVGWSTTFPLRWNVSSGEPRTQMVLVMKTAKMVARMNNNCILDNECLVQGVHRFNLVDKVKGMKRERPELVLQKHGGLYCPSFWPNPIWFSEVLRF